jgi:hypothetical protein
MTSRTRDVRSNQHFVSSKRLKFVNYAGSNTRLSIGVRKYRVEELLVDTLSAFVSAWLPHNGCDCGSLNSTKFLHVDWLPSRIVNSPLFNESPFIQEDACIFPAFAQSLHLVDVVKQIDLLINIIEFLKPTTRWAVLDINKNVLDVFLETFVFAAAACASGLLHSDCDLIQKTTSSKDLI